MLSGLLLGVLPSLWAAWFISLVQVNSNLIITNLSERCKKAVESGTVSITTTRYSWNLFNIHVSLENWLFDIGTKLRKEVAIWSISPLFQYIFTFYYQFVIYINIEPIKRKVIIYNDSSNWHFFLKQQHSPYIQ